MRKLNVLFVSHSSELYGAELNLLDIMRSLDREQFEPVLLCPRKMGALPEAARKHGIAVEFAAYRYWIWRKVFYWRYPIYLLMNALSVFPIARIIRKRSIDLVYTNTSTVISGALAARWTGRRHVWHMHESITKDPTGFKFFGATGVIFSVVANLSRRVIVNSKYLENLFPAKYRDKIRIIYNSFEVDSDIYAGTDAGAVRANYREAGVTPESKVVGVVGSLCQRKNPDKAIRAMPALLEAYPESKLMLFGDDRAPEDSYVGRIKRLAARLGVSNNVIFAGYVSDQRKIYGAIDVLLFPSCDETFGRVAVESALFKVPVIASSVGGIPEIIEHGRTGILGDMEEPANIANLLVGFFSGEYDTASMAESAHRFVKKRFALSTMRDQVKDCLLETAA